MFALLSVNIEMLSLRYEGKIVSSIFASKMPRKLIPKIAR